ncbi:MAG: spermidine synthase [Candidatus Azotimanducaceae bacterium WSBS_2022_MAG_OTU7]
MSTKNITLRFAIPFAIALLLSANTSYSDLVVHREKSLYRNIVVSDKAGQRCLIFSVKRQQRNQTCIDLDDPTRIIFDYVRMTFAGLLVNPEPTRSLMIGMGGGTISSVLTSIYPELTMDLVEVDQAVVKVATEYFGFRKTDQINVHIADGRVFTRRALLRKEKYDLIILDAFTGEYIPEHLMTVEFLENIKSLLTPDGIVVANTFWGSALYHHESVTYSTVFGPVFSLKMPDTGNRVIVATMNELPDSKTLMANAMILKPDFERFGVDLRKYVPNMNRDPDWKTDKRPLTDQYAPANLLKGR